jgi:hypothetical protein
MSSESSSARLAGKHQYRTSPGHQLDERRLRLRGGALDGQGWVGVIGVGRRVLCSPGPWSTEGIYVVTAEEVVDAEGRLENIAIPAFAAS